MTGQRCAWPGADELFAPWRKQFRVVMTGQRCAWPGCPVTASRGRLMCYRHWVRLPKRLRAPIWEHYVPGQTALTCTPDYRDALREVLAYARRVNGEAEAGRQRAAGGQEGLW